MSSVREIPNEEIYETKDGDREFTVFLGGILVALTIGLIVGPFLALKMFPSYFCLCGG